MGVSGDGAGAACAGDPVTGRHSDISPLAGLLAGVMRVI